MTKKKTRDRSLQILGEQTLKTTNVEQISKEKYFEVKLKIFEEVSNQIEALRRGETLDMDRLSKLKILSDIIK